MERNISLKVFEHVFNKDTCEWTIENEQTFGPYTVLNAVNQYWGPQLLGSGGWQWLNPMAKYVDLCRTRCNLIYIWSPNPVTITMTAFSTVTGTGYTITRNNTSRVNSFTIDPEEFAQQMNGIEAPDTAGNVARIGRIVVSVEGQQLVQFNLVDCCCINRIAWQHSGGGYSYLNFDCGTTLSVQSQGVEVCRYQDKTVSFSPILDATRQRGGNSIANRTSFEKMKFKTYIDARDKRTQRYLADFLSSGSYFYEFDAFIGVYDDDPNYRLVKFIPDYGSLKYHEDEELFELSFGGKIARPHNMPNYEI